MPNRIFVIAALAGLASPAARAAEPFMDSAPGHCFPCQFSKPRAIRSKEDTCAEPDQISQSAPSVKRQARGGGHVTN
jgi:hypothetical protein